MRAEEQDIVRRLADLPDDRKDRLFDLLAMPEDEYQVIRKLPKSKEFWLGVVATISVIGGGIWAIITVAPDRAADAAGAAFRQHGP